MTEIVVKIGTWFLDAYLTLIYVNVLKIIFYLSSYLLKYELRLQFQRVK